MDTYCLDREVFSPVYNKEGQLVGYNTFREIFLIHAKGADGNNYETGPYKVEIFVKARDLVGFTSAPKISLGRETRVFISNRGVADVLPNCHLKFIVQMLNPSVDPTASGRLQLYKAATTLHASRITRGWTQNNHVSWAVELDP